MYATRHAEQYGLPKVASCIARGARPRATLALANAARAMAFMDMRDYVTPEDIQSLAIDVLQHRISLTYEAEVDHIHSIDIIESILSKVAVPCPPLHRAKILRSGDGAVRREGKF